MNCNERLPLPKRHPGLIPGLTDWKVFDIGLPDLIEYRNPESVPPQILNLQYCMRGFR
jgi:hypothetical protein